MKAIIITQPGDASVLQLHDVPTPEPAPNQVLIRVKAAGLNRSDVALRSGGYSGTNPTGAIPGLEVAGVVEQCGSAVGRWRVGDAVCALLSAGGYAEYVAVDERHCLPVLPVLTPEEAASLPETVLTVWSTVFQGAHLQQGEHLLVHGGSSGIGLTAIQLAVAFGAKPFATAGSDEKRAFCEQMGAVRCVNYKTEDFELVLKAYGMDVILDMVGGSYTPKNVRLLNTDGRLTFINAMQNPKIELTVMDVMSKRLTITGSMLKPRSAEFKAALVADVEQHVWPLLPAGQLKPVIHRVFPLREAADAQRLMESSQHIGKLILTTGL